MSFKHIILTIIVFLSLLINSPFSKDVEIKEFQYEDNPNIKHNWLDLLFGNSTNDTITLQINDYNDKSSTFLINNFEIQIPARSLKDFIRKNNNDIYKEDFKLRQINLNIKNDNSNKMDYYYPLLYQNLETGCFKIKRNNEYLTNIKVTEISKPVNKNTEDIFFVYLTNEDEIIFKHLIGWNHYNTWSKEKLFESTN